MKFSNETFNDSNPSIIGLQLFHSENIALDSTFLNPSVFKNLLFIQVKCSLSSISIELFTSLKNLYIIHFETIYFRKLIHRNGIEWIRGINRDLHVNLSNLNDIIGNYKTIKHVFLTSSKGLHIEPMSVVFPEEDFCVYKEYPFDQMVFTSQYCQFVSAMIRLNF